MYNDNLQALAQESSFKPGCNMTERAQIVAKLEAGATPQEVSQEMRIALTCVASFAPQSAAAEEETDPGEGFFKKKKK